MNALHLKTMGKIAFFGAVLLFSNACYLTLQAREYIKDHTEASAFETVQAGRSVSTLFQRIDAIRSFGVETLDLKNTKSYTKYVKTNQSYLVDVVSAVKSDSFERYTWWYPLFGRLPYRGFYFYADAEQEAEKFRKQGYDVYVRKVDSFSSHGYFPELVYTYMAEYTEYHLAELVLHELAHSKLWLRGKTQFNEEFASFVGTFGARQYMQDVYGVDAPIIAEHDAFRRDYDRFIARIAGLREELLLVYDSSLSTTAKLSEKERVIARFKQNYTKAYAEEFETDSFAGISNITINNAFIDLYQVYYGNSDAFLDAHKRMGSKLAETINAIAAFKELDSKDFDPYAALAGLGQDAPVDTNKTE